VLALALGIGANTAIFTVVNAVLLQTLPYRDPSKLVMVWETNPKRDHKTNVISPANFLDWKDQNSVFEDMAMFIDIRFNLTGVDEPEEIPGQIATPNIFSVLGTNAALGRAFTPDDVARAGDHLVVLSHELWVRKFGAEREIIDKTISLNGENYRVAGVMPAGFQLYIKQWSQVGRPAEMWLPINLSPQARVRRGRAWMSVARLKPGVTVPQAQSEMDSIAAQLDEQYHDFNAGWGARVVAVREQVVGDIRLALLVLSGAVGFVLLIACANVANLLLARAAARQKEIAIRTALGAGRWRVVRQLLTESVLLSVMGGAAGLMLAIWGTDLLLAVSPRDLIGLDHVRVNTNVLLFTAAVTLLTGLIFGIAPSISASKANLSDALKEGGRDSSGGGRSQKIRSIFVVAEVALALVLLIGAGLMIQSLWKLQAINPGFDPSRMLTARLVLPSSKYAQDQRRIQFFKDLVQRAQSIPGVKAASAIDVLPFGGLGSATSFFISGTPKPAPGEEPTTDVRVVEPNYFGAMGIPFLSGRTFTEREATEASHVVVINRRLAEQYFPGEDPIGKKIAIVMMDQPPECEVVGIVEDVKYSSLEGDVRAMAYWPHPELVRSFMTLLIRTEGDPTSISAAVRGAVRDLDADQPVADLRTMEQLIAATMSRTRFSALLLSVFAAVALILSTVGIYGVMSYSVAQRSHEIGIRMALGADRRRVVGMIVRQGMTLAGIGVAAGLAGAYALTRFLESLLYQISSTDLPSFAVLSLALCTAALLASVIPARRATKVDPLVALRYE